MTEGRTGLRLKMLSVLVVVMFAALTTRLWYLQVLATERYKDIAENNRLRVVEVAAPRGRILDRNGELLVENRVSLEVLVNRQELGDEADQVLLRLARLLDVRVRDLLDRLETKQYYEYQPVPVATDVPKDVVFTIAEHPALFAGVSYAQAPVRRYPEDKLAAHILGYVGPISSVQLEQQQFRKYGQNDIVGKAGVEAVYERWLQGQKGLVKYRVNAAGENLGQIGTEQEPVAGDDLVLSIDAEIQRLAEGSLEAGMRASRGIYDEASKRYLRANAGAIVVLDPENGEVVAIASSPTYGPKAFVRGFTQREYDRRFLRERSGFPLLNRATQGQYAPGSTYKPFIALSAFRRGVGSPVGQYDCPSTFVVNPGTEFRQVFHNWSSYDRGLISMSEALRISCDTVFYGFGYRYWQMYYKDPNREPLQQDLRAQGFGRPTHVDLPDEKVGRVPDAEWKAWIHEKYPNLFPYGDWFPGDYILMSIGQGETLVTPLQLAAGFAAIQNGGLWCEPHVGLRIQDGRRVVKQVRPDCHKLPFSPSQVDFVRRALEGVVQPGGTAGYAFAGFPFDRVWVAGKTGTAQVVGKQDYSWFAAMTAADGKQYVVVALVEQGGHGSTTAAPIVRNVIEGIYGLPITRFPEVAGTD